MISLWQARGKVGVPGLIGMQARSTVDRLLATR